MITLYGGHTDLFSEMLWKDAELRTLAYEYSDQFEVRFGVHGNRWSVSVPVDFFREVLVIEPGNRQKAMAQLAAIELMQQEVFQSSAIHLVNAVNNYQMCVNQQECDELLDGIVSSKYDVLLDSVGKVLPNVESLARNAMDWMQNRTLKDLRGLETRMDEGVEVNDLEGWWYQQHKMLLRNFERIRVGVEQVCEGASGFQRLMEKGDEFDLEVVEYFTRIENSCVIMSDIGVDSLFVRIQGQGEKF